MQTLLQPCNSVSSLSSSPFSAIPIISNFPVSLLAVQARRYSLRDSCLIPFSSLSLLSSTNFFTSPSSHRTTHVALHSQNDIFDGFSITQSPQKPENEELELRSKPSPVYIEDGSAAETEESAGESGEDEALAPFLKFFKNKEDPLGDDDDERDEVEVFDEHSGRDSVDEKVSVEYYEPKQGDFVVGVVVSGNENRLDVNVGADLLGTMLTKEVLPLYEKEMDHLLCDLNNDPEAFTARGKMGIVKYDDAMSAGPGPGRPVVETGTVLFAEVLGRTLSGRPLLSTRRLFRRIAWLRVRQIKQLNEPLEVKITEWNTGGLLTRIEGLRAFLPKAELLNRVNNFTKLKENVGRQIQVLISRIDEDKNDLILSEKDAWEMLHLQEGTLLDGTVKKILPYGAQIRIGDTNRSGLLHISKITATRITSVSDVLSVDEKVKVLVVKSIIPDKISLSIVDLESEPGLFISNKEKVFSEAEMMAKKYRQKLPAVIRAPKSEASATLQVPLDSEASFYANWKWFKFDSEQ
ncbi:protein PIGMENT DEFECTIVE 338, chloroplastic isoform X1 [Rhodamnia argentea]|uniref:Protein PIGMENT DEFECTIVE 338, chloroplastic isoform X1 n=1 Tax=Rhodamnia argentea TaxID=178133 RepID=A0A8B8QUS9_9MYRT|nr:protein PIGMENT DEFECTIVE 338, chloroplastic isoform X1 [Rhodamnia argentea]